MITLKLFLKKKPTKKPKTICKITSTKPNTITFLNVLTFYARQQRTIVFDCLETKFLWEKRQKMLKFQEHLKESRSSVEIRKYFVSAY